MLGRAREQSSEDPNQNVYSKHNIWVLSNRINRYCNELDNRSWEVLRCGRKHPLVAAEWNGQPRPITLSLCSPHGREWTVCASVRLCMSKRFCVCTFARARQGCGGGVRISTAGDKRPSDTASHTDCLVRRREATPVHTGPISCLPKKTTSYSNMTGSHLGSV